MFYYDQLIEYTHNKQNEHGRVFVGQSVPHPILVLVIGDQQQESLENLYTQLTGHWSSRLEALQFCYFYQKSSYQGRYSDRILQVQIEEELPAGRCGAGVLCDMPESLKRVNSTIFSALDQISRAPNLAMTDLWIPVILSPVDPLQALLSDIVAVAHAQADAMTILDRDCRVYLTLPLRISQTVKAGTSEMDIARAFIEQLDTIANQTYEQDVWQENADDEPLRFHLNGLVNTVVILDMVNEHGVHYNTDGERLRLICDLIEFSDTWSCRDFLRTAGAQAVQASPAYWLSQAVNELCAEADQSEDPAASLDEKVRALQDAITKEVGEKLDSSMEDAMNRCCVFRPQKLDQLKNSTMSLQEAEEEVFGKAMAIAFDSWADRQLVTKPTREMQQSIDELSTASSLKQLAARLRRFANDCEGRSDPLEMLDCRKLSFDRSASITQKAMAARKYFIDMKYKPLLNNKNYECQAAIARACAGACFGREENLEKERSDFNNFSQAIQQVWIRMRDGFGNLAQPVTWRAEKPAPQLFRRTVSEVMRSENLSPVLDLVVNSIDLGGGKTNPDNMDVALYCRLPQGKVGLINEDQWLIERGVSAGRVVRMFSLSTTFSRQALGKVALLQSVVF